MWVLFLLDIRKNIRIRGYLYPADKHLNHHKWFGCRRNPSETSSSMSKSPSASSAEKPQR